MRARGFGVTWKVMCVAALLSLPVAGCGGAEQGTDPVAATAEQVETVVEPAAAEETAEPEPVVEHARVEKRKSIPFTSRVQKTAELEKGVRRVSQQGRNGVRLTIWRVTTTDGETTAKKLLRSVVQRRPVPRITLIGTYVAPPPSEPTCDPNYSGACVPISSDVDCGGGSGNGPAYVHGAVKVVGSDIYDLDADGDGWGCD